ncbi:hypothetical protein GCM10023085_44670 [Actinomadura viridis]
MTRPAPLAALAAVVLTTTACSYADYNERIGYLRKVAGRGVETHNLLASQGTKVDARRCNAAYDALADKDLPNDVAGTQTAKWEAQVRQFFVDSCVTGLPKPVPGQPTPSKPQPTTPTPSPTSERTR